MGCSRCVPPLVEVAGDERRLALRVATPVEPEHVEAPAVPSAIAKRIVSVRFFVSPWRATAIERSAQASKSHPSVRVRPEE